MKIFGIVSFFVFLIVPVSLFAQQGGGTSSFSNDFGDTFGGVQNVSEQSVGTFIGGGRPTNGFVGNVEIYNTSSSRSANTARQNTTARPVTAARSVTATAARRVTTPTTRAGQLGANQTIRSATSMDFDFVIPPSRLQPATVETLLNRVHGIQDSRVTFSGSPQGTTAVLTGTVASDRERRVAEQFLLMEPGINRVQNLLELR
ncbi:MAG: hypothetical protein FWE95_01925 [Planctomycetaceae bacterium]|nr:hypothetical protein [Planctomycetaceae bacterium]